MSSGSVVVGAAATRGERVAAAAREERVFAAAWKRAARWVCACARVLRWRGEMVVVGAGDVGFGFRGKGVRRAMARLRSVRVVWACWSRSAVRGAGVGGGECGCGCGWG